MPKPVTKFQTNDGRVFNTEDEARRHEDLDNSIQIIFSVLKPRPKDSSFTNGDLGYIQQEAWAVASASRGIERLKRGRSERVISESEPLIWAAILRLMCIDEQGREWGQPYYRNNPDKSPNQTRYL